MNDRRSGRLPENLAVFCRSLRALGISIGTAQVIAALEAAAAIGPANRSDWKAGLRCSLISDPVHFPAFDDAFERYFRGATQPPGSPADEPKSLADAGRSEDRPRRRHIQTLPGDADVGEAKVETPSGLAGYSAREVFRQRDFESMSEQELREAGLLLREELVHLPRVPGRRLEYNNRGRRADLRGAIRQMLRHNGEMFDIPRLRAADRPPELVLLCDVSGSMSAYSRAFLQFAHAIARQSRPVNTFVFGTRLTDVTRALRHRHADTALAQVARMVRDWDGGTRIAACLRDFNLSWGRRLLSRGAAVILLTDGLDRDTSGDLGFQVERLRRSCRQLIWLNPMLRYSGFQPLAWGVKTMLPHVDAFLPAHTINSLTEVVAVLRQVSLASVRLGLTFFRSGQKHAHNHVGERFDVVVLIEINTAGVTNLERKSKGAARGDANQIKEQRRVAGRRDAAFLQGPEFVDDAQVQRPQMHVNQPVESGTRSAGLLQHQLVERRFFCRVANIGSNHRCHAFAWRAMCGIASRVDQHCGKFREHAIGGCPPELFLVLEVIGDQRVMDAGPLRDIACGGALEPILRERLKRCIEQFLACFYAALLLLTCRLFRRSRFRIHGSLSYRRVTSTGGA